MGSLAFDKLRVLGLEFTYIKRKIEMVHIGGRSVLSSDLGSSTSMSFSSSMATYTSNAKTFTLAEMERATDNFSPENVIGEGGFGRVYYGVLDDGLKVAVKSLTRDEGGKEFIAEVEMLSRLHHRNLVKLIGICTEDHSRCLVYELIPNGSVESHLHGKQPLELLLFFSGTNHVCFYLSHGVSRRSRSIVIVVSFRQVICILIHLIMCEKRGKVFTSVGCAYV
jgi:serine/threonine protein kinase